MQKTRIFEERNILKLSDWPFIVNLHFWFQDDKFLYFVLDYAECGDLLSLINKFFENDGLNEEMTRFITAEIVIALEYLHKNGIIYRDLKPQNILIDSEGHIKLTDFGLAKSKFNSKQENTLWGTIKYMAPEILMMQKYDMTVDYWSLGIIIFRLLTGILPYNNSNSSEIKNIIRYDDFDFDIDTFSVETKEILSGLLEKDPKKRLGAKGIDEIK